MPATKNIIENTTVTIIPTVKSVESFAFKSTLKSLIFGGANLPILGIAAHILNPIKIKNDIIVAEVTFFDKMLENSTILMINTKYKNKIAKYIIKC